MAYKRYIKRRKKVYGPYVYHSRKEGGKVISEYKGKYKKYNKKSLIFFIIGLPALSFIIILIQRTDLQDSITGLISSEAPTLSNQTFEITITGGVDSFVNQNQPNTNYGSNNNILVSEGSGEYTTGLIVFDVSNILSDATINNAKLKLYFNQSVNNPSNKEKKDLHKSPRKGNLECQSKL